jgi:hypothetical protein
MATMRTSDPVLTAVVRFRMDLETARAALTRANRRLSDLDGQDKLEPLSREQLSTFIGDHDVNLIVAEINDLGQAIARKTA